MESNGVLLYPDVSSELQAKWVNEAVAYSETRPEPRVER